MIEVEGVYIPVNMDGLDAQDRRAVYIAGVSDVIDVALAEGLISADEILGNLDNLLEKITGRADPEKVVGKFITYMSAHLEQIVANEDVPFMPQAFSVEVGEEGAVQFIPTHEHH